MLVECTKEEWLAALRWGDIGLVKGNSLLAKGEYLLNKLEKIDGEASHGFIVKNAPQISEAEFKGITDKNKITKYLGGKLTVWVFRYFRSLTPEEVNCGASYLYGVDNEAVYGSQGIKQFIKKFFLKLVGKEYTPKDRQGIFCTEHSSKFIRVMALVYSAFEPEQISPSMQLEYFETNAGMWPIALLFDGQKYYIDA